MAQQPSGRDPFDALEVELEGLPKPVQRRALMLLGLAVGDAVGLPFELSVHVENRRQADEMAMRSHDALLRFTLGRIVERLGRKGPSNAFARTFSDDTVVTDLKMGAIAQCAELLERPAFCESPSKELLWRCFLSQLLAWSWGPAKGRLFQGYGGFTKGLLRPEAPQGSLPSLSIGDDLLGCQTWPEEWFVEHAERCCATGSYGNGAAMSFAPQVVAAEVVTEMRDKSPIDADAGAAASSSAVVSKAWTTLKAGLSCLAETHLHEHARSGARLFGEILTEVLHGRVGSCVDLCQAVRRCPCWEQLLASEELADHPAYALRAFDSFLTKGDCTEEEERTFLLLFSREESPQLAVPMQGAYSRNMRGARMGRLLRTASNWDDDNPRQSLLALEDGQAVRFSQRCLNSVLLAVWCCSGAETMWDWLTRLLYVGGDSDTVGAICGQLAGPLLPAKDVCRSFRRFVAVDDCIDHQPCARISAAAAARYFSRVLLFVVGRWRELAERPRLVDPFYAELTDPEGTQASGATAKRVLWVDTAFASHAGRIAGQRRAAAEDAACRGIISLNAVTSADEATWMLERARRGEQRVDVVITELHLGRHRQAGLELLQMVSAFWDNCAETRPHFVLMTPSHDREIAATVKRHTSTALVRHDRPELILQTLLEARCVAARLPEALPEMPRLESL